MAVLLNRLTGEAFEPDARQQRIRRMRRRISAWASLIAHLRLKRRKTKIIMVTLTLRPGVTWSPNMVREFMLRVKRVTRGRLLAYAWVAEMQRRGAVHYHVLLVVPRDLVIPKPDRAGLWTYGSTRIETARKVWYIVKYTQKAEGFVIFPRGLRLFAVYVAQNCAEAVGDIEAWRFKLSTLPAWAADEVAESYELWKWRRTVRGFWLSPPGGGDEVKIETDWVYLRNLNLRDIEGLW